MPGMNAGGEGLRRRYDTAVFEPFEIGNGATVWMQRPALMPDDRGILIAALVPIGSRLDPPDRGGLAHFFEHVPFRGSRRYPSKRALAGAVEGRGGALNGGTGPSVTMYTMELPGGQIRLAANLLREMLFEPLIRPEDLEAERGVILGEYENDMASGELIEMDWQRRVYAPHPVGNCILGHPDSIRRIQTADYADFHRRYYHAGNLHLVCGGSFAAQSDALKVLVEAFGDIPRGCRQSLDHEPPFVFRPGRESCVNECYARDFLRVTFPVAVDYISAAPALTLFESLLNGFSSPLVLALREERGYTYDTEPFRIYCPCGMSTATFEFPLAAAHHDEAEAITYRVLAEITPDAIRAAQHKRQMTRAMAFSHPCETAEDAVTDIVYRGRVFSWNDVAAAEDALTLEEVFAWRDYFLSAEPLVYRFLAEEP